MKAGLMHAGGGVTQAPISSGFGDRDPTGTPGGSAAVRHWPWVLLVLTAGTVILLPSLAWPFGRDQGSYAYAAWRWQAGQLPYRDVYVFKPPLTVLVHLLALEMFGHSMMSIRLLDGLLQLLTAVGVAWLTWKASNGRRIVSVFAALLYLAALYRLGLWFTAQTDGWFNPLTIGAIVLAVRWREDGNEPARLLWIAGAFLGLAFVAKYTAVVMCLPVLVALRVERPKRLVKPALLILAGALAVIGVTVLALALGNVLPSFLEIQSELVNGYSQTALSVSSTILAVRTAMLDGHLTFAMIGVVAGPIAYVLMTRMGENVEEYGIVVAWLIAGAISLVVQRRGFYYHAVPMYAPAAVVLALTVGLLGDLLPVATRRVRSGVAALVCLLLVIGFAPALSLYRLAARWSSGDLSLRAAQEKMGTVQFTDMPIDGQFELSDWLRSHVEPSDNVFVWGFDPAVLFLSERRQSSRYLYNYPFVSGWHLREHERSLMKALDRAPPAVVAVALGDHFGPVSTGASNSIETYEHFPRLEEYVREHCTVEHRLKCYLVYECQS